MSERIAVETSVDEADAGADDGPGAGAVGPDLDLGAVLNGIGEGFFALDADWRFTVFNPAAEAIFDLKRADVIGRTIWELSPGIVGTDFERHYRMAMTARKKTTFESYSRFRPNAYHEIRAFPLGSGIGVAFLDVSSRLKTDRALREREAELARVQRIGGVGGLEVELTGGFPSRRSPEYLHLHGLSPDAANEGHADWIARVHPDDRVWVERHLLDTLAGSDVTYKAEYRIIRPNDGETRWIRAIAEIERAANGRALRLVGAHLDITDRKLAERALVESEERFRSIANSVPVPIWVAGLDGRREFVNEAYLAFTGLRYDEALSFNSNTIVHFEDLARYLEELQAGLATEGQFTIEARFLRGDGEWRWLSIEFQPRFASQQRRDGTICVAHDVTSAKEAEHKLTQLNELLELRIEQRSSQLAATEALIRTFFQHSSECHAILVEMPGGQFVYEEVNPATLQLYGKRREEVVGSSLEALFGPAAADEIARHLVASLATNQPQRYERVQSDRIIEAVTTPIPTRGSEPRRLIVSARDVSERRRLEDQLRQAQKMEAVGQLTGGVAHDFNNLLTIVMGGLEAIGRHAATLEASVVQARILRSKTMAMQGVERAAALTSRLLSFSRQQSLNPQPIDANKLIADIVDMLRRTIGEAVLLETFATEGLWTAYADPNQLENAILNLALNARDAMPNGGRLTIETRNVTLDGRSIGRLAEAVANGDYVMIAVADTGIGMDRATQARAFDPFFTTKEVGKGTGLGLSQVYGFARQSSGHVMIYSEPGIGTTIRLYLPRHRGRNEAAEVPVHGDIEGARGEETILVVEDDDGLRTYTTEILRELGYRVTEAANGYDALAMIANAERLDLLLSDVVMAGGLNGRELASRATQMREGLKVLLMTGYSRNAIADEDRAELVGHIIGKPFSYRDLAAKVRARLDLAQ